MPSGQERRRASVGVKRASLGSKMPKKKGKKSPGVRNRRETVGGAAEGSSNRSTTLERENTKGRAHVIKKWGIQ